MTPKEWTSEERRRAEQIIRLLEEDARLTDAQLAVMLDAPAAEVAALRRTLEEQGILRAYRTVIDWERTGRQLVTALIELRVTPRRDRGFEEIAEQVMRLEEVESVYLMSGGYDLSVTVTGRTFQEVASFVARRLSTLDGVLSTATHFVLRRYKDAGVLLAGEERDDRGVQ